MSFVGYYTNLIMANGFCSIGKQNTKIASDYPSSFDRAAVGLACFLNQLGDLS